MVFSDNTLHDLREVEMEIMDVIDRVCRNHSLKYTLAFGSLLGAVRHGGFIPWDDDIDIIMPIDDYNTMLSIWDDVAPEGYVLQNKRTNSDFTQTFTKIRKDHTVFIQSESEKTKTYHKGIFVDVTPACWVAPGRIPRLAQIAAAAVNLLYSREHTSKSGALVVFCERILLSIPRSWRMRILSFTTKYLQRWSEKKNGGLFLPETMVGVRRIYPKTMFEDMKDIKFEDRKYMCVNDTDTILRLIYRDYMKLPPEEKRVLKHHPLILDMEHNYEELVAPEKGTDSTGRNLSCVSS